jgi:hypothetical protein
MKQIPLAIIHDRFSEVDDSEFVLETVNPYRHQQHEPDLFPPKTANILSRSRPIPERQVQRWYDEGDFSGRRSDFEWIPTLKAEVVRRSPSSCSHIGLFLRSLLFDRRICFNR